MQVNTKELNGVALDWAVAQAEGVALVDGCIFTKDPAEEQVLYSPSTDWAQGGPIIEREGMHVDCLRQGSKAVWEAWPYATGTKDIQVGHTPLIAAMRAFVAHKLGNTVEIPDELI